MGYIVISFAIGDVTNAMGAIEGNISGLNLNWKKLLADAIYITGQGIEGCDKSQAKALPPVTGEIVDRYRHDFLSTRVPNEGRGLGYSIVSTENFATVALVARNFGLDLFQYSAATGERIDMPAKYYSHYLYKFKDEGVAKVPDLDYIKSSGYQNETGYMHEIVKSGQIAVFDLLSKVYNEDIQIYQATQKYSVVERQKLFEPLYFGFNHIDGFLKWDFFYNKVHEGWTSGTNAHVEQLHASNGSLVFDVVGKDPQLISPRLNIRVSTAPGITPLPYRYMKIKLKVDPLASGSTSSLLQIFWASNFGQPFTPDKKAGAPIQTDGSWQEVVLDLGSNSKWVDMIQKLRIDPVSDAGNVQVEIDSITLSTSR